MFMMLLNGSGQEKAGADLRLYFAGGRAASNAPDLLCPQKLSGAGPG